MFRDLDDTIKALLETHATPGTELASAPISFDLPDAAWRSSVLALTVNCYLYDIRQNAAMRTNEPIIVELPDPQDPTKLRRTRVTPHARIDCAYCVTAWSAAVSGESGPGAAYEEHRLLSQVLRVFLRHSTIPPGVLQGELVGQPAPFPGIIASQDGVRNIPEFWSALEQKLKPSLNYVITLAMMVEDLPTYNQMPDRVTAINVTADHP